MVATRTPPARQDEEVPAPRHSHRPHLPSRPALALAALVTVSVIVFLTVGGGGGGGGASSVDHSVDDLYTVRTGDTISFVADLHAVSEEALMEVNDLTPSDALRPGDQLLMPRPPTEGREPPAELQAHPTKPELEPIFHRWAEEYDVAPALVKALAWVQSTWTASADVVSSEEDGEEGNIDEDSAEGVGIGRLAPETSRFINNEILGGAGLNPADLEDGIQLMSAYLGWLLDQNHGDWAATISGYRAGLLGPREGLWDLNRIPQITEVLELVPDFQVTLASLGIESATTTTAET